MVLAPILALASWLEAPAGGAVALASGTVVFFILVNRCGAVRCFARA